MTWQGRESVLWVVCLKGLRAAHFCERTLVLSLRSRGAHSEERLTVRRLGGEERLGRGRKADDLVLERWHSFSGI